MLVRSGYDKDLKLLGTDEITVSNAQENYEYILPEEVAVKKFFLLKNDGSMKPLSYAEIR